MNELLTVKEVMEILKVSRTGAYQLIWSGQIKSRRIGRLVRISSQDLGKFIQGQPYRKPEPIRNKAIETT